MTIDTISTDRLVACPCCGRSMRFARAVPKVGDLPEMETFECILCRLAVTAEQVLQFPELLSSAPAQSCQEKRSPDSLPWKCRGRSLRPWPYGGRCLNGLAVSDAFAYHRVSIFRDVLASTKGLLQRQQSRRPLGDANGFAFVPYHFKSNRRSRSSPSSPCQDAQSDPKSISP
jgi:hypothetical protein